MSDVSDLASWQKTASPAPWHGDHGEIYDADGNVVAYMHLVVSVNGEHFNVADEQLLAAAPAMLQMLSRVRIPLETCGYSDLAMQVYRLIEQVEGRSA